MASRKEKLADMRRRYSGRDDADVSEQLVREILDAYADAEARIYKAVADARATGWTAQAQKAWLALVDQELRRFETRWKKIAKRWLLQLVRNVTGQAIDDLKAMGGEVKEGLEFYRD